MVDSRAAEESYLVLGWQVTPSGEPQYWCNSDARPGSPAQEEYLVKIPAGVMGTHAAIIAQSGSGKSFFLGRLIEELMLRTKAHCIVLDPNADFRRIDEIEDQALWTHARYDATKRRGKLPHEGSREEFEEQWSRIQIQIKGRGFGQRGDNRERLTLWWPSLSVEFLGEDLDPILRSDLYHCHSFVQALETLWRHKRRKGRTPINLFAEATKLFRTTRGKTENELRAQLEQDFLSKEERDALSGNKSPGTGDFDLHDFIRTLRLKLANNAIERLLAAAQYVSEDVERFYFGKAREYMASGILETKLGAERFNVTKRGRLQVIDLPSLPDKGTRLLAINALLTTVWEEARRAWDSALKKPEDKDTRVPTFVVVDEAHNLIPADPRTRAETALIEQFRTIIAEGRKYGLFLVLVSQRPDKLDSLILSECENRAIMKLGSATVLNKTKQMLGLEAIPLELLEKLLEFEKGRVMLIGNWAPAGPQTIYSAPRRTKEGGRNLREQHWAIPAEQD